MELTLLQMAEACERAGDLLAEEVAVKTVREAWRRINPMPQVRVSRQANGEPWGGDGLGPYTDEYKAWERKRVQIEAYLKAGASLDAAMSLVPEGCAVDFRRFANGKARAVVWRTVTHPEPPFEHPCERAASAALAITAASLRARATKEQTND